MNVFIESAKSNDESYQVYKIMIEATLLLEDISNWYVRRNRRRFWKSENDGDKNAAYFTLVLELFFHHFGNLPVWFQTLWITVVASIFGIKGTQIFRNGGKK